jgi:hypothetical protein
MISLGRVPLKEIPQRKSLGRIVNKVFGSSNYTEGKVFKDIPWSPSL